MIKPLGKNSRNSFVAKGLNDRETIGMNTYGFEIRVSLTRRFTLIFRNINKFVSFGRRFWSIFHGRKGRP